MSKSSAAIATTILGLVAGLMVAGAAGGASRATTPKPLIYSQVFTVTGSSQGDALVSCPSGKNATGGGVYFEGTRSEGDQIADSGPAHKGTPAENGFHPESSGRASGWHVRVFNGNANDRRADVYVICM